MAGHQDMCQGFGGAPPSTSPGERSVPCQATP
jgi:hypothetical protein